ncbi:hypothetical protein AGLY_007682 [Aphis glycines]|uniref:Uncharacterized protein n=1 Tax=Aphis glycines TaxID=307491 RepID=A0A6G0TN62_APHGL|nr:hypothetical protein AGLY_007682 [Aphis glycines]
MVNSRTLTTETPNGISVLICYMLNFILLTRCLICHFEHFVQKIGEKKIKTFILMIILLYFFITIVQHSVSIHDKRTCVKPINGHGLTYYMEDLEEYYCLTFKKFVINIASMYTNRFDILLLLFQAHSSLAFHTPLPSSYCSFLKMGTVVFSLSIVPINIDIAPHCGDYLPPLMGGITATTSFSLKVISKLSDIRILYFRQLTSLSKKYNCNIYHVYYVVPIKK